MMNQFLHKGQTAYIMMGNIGTGKSHTTEFLLAVQAKDAVVINIDTILPAMFPQIAYHDLFGNPDRWMLYEAVSYDILNWAISLGLSAIVDATNMSAKKRGKLFAAVNGRCPVVGIVHKHVDGLKIRKKSPRNGTDEIWDGVHAKFAKAWEAPTIDEGFKQLILVDNWHWTTYYEEVPK